MKRWKGIKNEEWKVSRFSVSHAAKVSGGRRWEKREVERGEEARQSLFVVRLIKMIITFNFFFPSLFPFRIKKKLKKKSFRGIFVFNCEAKERKPGTLSEMIYDFLLSFFLPFFQVIKHPHWHYSRCYFFFAVPRGTKPKHKKSLILLEQ